MIANAPGPAQPVINRASRIVRRGRPEPLRSAAARSVSVHGMTQVSWILVQAGSDEGGSARLAALPLGIAALVILAIVVRAIVRARRARRDQLADGSGGQ
jgi:hypothetical protein